VLLLSHLGQMKKARIAKAKNQLNALIAGLKSGSPVLIVDRGRPVARLEPVASRPNPDPDGRLLRLIRESVVQPARAAPKRQCFSSRGPSRGAASGTVKFWDAPAIVPLLIAEISTPRL